jgi:hypothetical protein
MKQSVFISFSVNDLIFVQRLKHRLIRSLYLKPIIITEKRQPGYLNTEKVTEGIIESAFVVPIITKASINSQWLNQEIGFASALKKNIYPIVEKSCLNDLKGFVNKEIDQPYMFKGSENVKTERENFRKCLDKLIPDLEDLSKPLNISDLNAQDWNYIKGGSIVKFDENSRSILIGQMVHHIDSSETFHKLLSLKIPRNDRILTSLSKDFKIGRSVTS